MKPPKIAWIIPEFSGGIRSYSRALLTKIKATEVLDSDLIAGKISEAPRLVHLQHEFGLFGSKLPGRYRFPKWFKSLRDHTPGAKWVATAHTVLDEKWRYRTSGQGWKALPISVLNLFVPILRKTWMDHTWREFDAVIVHSENQVATIRKSGCPTVKVIPHFVPESRVEGYTEPSDPTVLLFGYFSPEKGQDIVIQAWQTLGESAPKLILAGGARRQEDQGYFRMCTDAIRRLGLEGKIQITGYVPDEKVSDYFAQATLVLAPFRETSGSGSLATALGYGAAILASDLPLNRELERRMPGCLAFFKTESAEALAEEIRSLLGDSMRRSSLRIAALEYAEAYSVEKVAKMHEDFYAELLAGISDRKSP